MLFTIDGQAFNDAQCNVSRVGDLDDDGTLDVLVANIDSAPRPNVTLAELIMREGLDRGLLLPSLEARSEQNQERCSPDWHREQIIYWGS